jgi:GNAT superfamily N-acetyltransferase
MLEGEQDKVHKLIKKTFDKYIAHEYSEEGIIEFEKYIGKDNLLRRQYQEHFIIVAVGGDNIVGVIEVRKPNHISIFFVDERHQGKGIGKILCNKAIEKCKKENSQIEHITVNSSPYAVCIYKKLGFKPTQSEKVKNGIRYVPMELSL